MAFRDWMRCPNCGRPEITFEVYSDGGVELRCPYCGHVDVGVLDITPADLTA